MNDPLLDALSTLPAATAPAARSERTIARCRRVLTRRRCACARRERLRAASRAVMAALVAGLAARLGHGPLAKRTAGD